MKDFTNLDIPYFWQDGKYHLYCQSYIDKIIQCGYVWVSGKWIHRNYLFPPVIIRPSFKKLNRRLIHTTNTINNLKIHNITPLKTKDKTKDLIGVIDIETLNYNGKLYPYAVGVTYLLKGCLKTVTFYIEPRSKSNKTIESRSELLMLTVCAFLEQNLKDYTLYAHNLGKFDGYLLIKPFLKHFGPFKILIDKSRTIICINLPGNITLKDSYRILPHSLAKLGDMFETEHRKLEFDHKQANTQSIYNPQFEAELLKYLEHDLLCLIEVITKATTIIHEIFEVDLNDCYSTSSLAFKIYRTNFMLKESIPILPIWLDRIIRTSYRGGSVDVYKVYGDEAYYYDVNSLYPYSICKFIPYEYLGFKFIPNLNNFFGFIIAYVYIPKNVKVPLVGVKSDSGSLYYPTGYIKGLFFSEELKAFKQQGYKVYSIYGYEFSKADLFSKYVNTIYNLKANSSGAKREFIKLLLNGLYGYFGRDINTVTTSFITNPEYQKLSGTNHILEVIPITDQLAIILYETLPDKDLCIQNKQSYNKIMNITTLKNPIYSNVAIASAITSYSRIHIIFFKTLSNNELLYSDTDSVFLSQPLDPTYVDSQLLGIIKDELKGDKIIEYLFLEPKLYYYKTSQGIEIFKARGVPKGSINRELIFELWEGKTIEFKFTRLYKSLTNSSISEKDIKYRLKVQYDRKIPLLNESGKLIAYIPKHLPFKKSIFSNKQV